MSNGGPESSKQSITAASVFFCPNGESTRMSIDSMKIRLSSATTFKDLHYSSCLYYSQNPKEWALRNENGAIWPPKSIVIDEMRHGGSVRLTPNDEKFDVEEKVEEETVEEEEQAEDDGRVAGARVPKTRELFMHLSSSILIVDTYLARTRRRGTRCTARWRTRSSSRAARGSKPLPRWRRHLDAFVATLRRSARPRRCARGCGCASDGLFH